MTKSEPIELTLTRGVVRGLRLGDGSGPKVLALHGWLDNAHSFLPMAPYLAGLDIVAIDLPGHGLSDHRAPGMFYHFVDWPFDVVSVLDALEWPSAALLGHSMGAGISSLVAGLVPERIRAAVLLEGLGPLASDPAQTPDNMLRALEDMSRLEQRAPRPYVSLDVAASQLMKVAPRLSHPSALLLCERGMREVEGGFAWRADPRLRVTSPARMTQDMVLAFLRRVTAPTLLIQAKDGMPFDVTMMRERRDVMSTLELAVLEGGHHLHMDEAKTVAETIAPYLLGTKR